MKDRGVGPRRMLQVVLTPDVAADHGAPGTSPQTRGHLLERTDQGRLLRTSGHHHGHRTTGNDLGESAFISWVGRLDDVNPSLDSNPNGVGDFLRGENDRTPSE